MTATMTAKVQDKAKIKIEKTNNAINSRLETRSRARKVSLIKRRMRLGRSPAQQASRIGKPYDQELVQKSFAAVKKSVRDLDTFGCLVWYLGNRVSFDLFCI